MVSGAGSHSSGRSDTLFTHTTGRKGARSYCQNALNKHDTIDSCIERTHLLFLPGGLRGRVGGVTLAAPQPFVVVSGGFTCSREASKRKTTREREVRGSGG